MGSFFHDLEPEKAKELAQRAGIWISSADGKAALEKSIQKTTELTDRLDRERRVDPKTLTEPVTI